MLNPFYDFQGGIVSCIPGFRLPLFPRPVGHHLAGASIGRYIPRPAKISDTSGVVVNASTFKRIIYFHRLLKIYPTELYAQHHYAFFVIRHSK